MSTRANIIVKGNEYIPTTHYYKHHDGYITNGLGGMLADFVKDTKDITNEKFMTKFICHSIVKFGRVSNVVEIGITDSVHGDVEYVYEYDNNTLGVYIRGENWELEGEQYKQWRYVVLVSEDVYNLDVFGELKV
jgi:hypothetical protein